MNKIVFSFNRFPLSIILLLVFLIGCDRIYDIITNPEKKSDDRSDEGLCIYLTEIEHTSDLTYQFVDVQKVPIIGKPIISYNDIISYDTTAHILSLLYNRDSLENRIAPIGVYGKPFLVTLDSTKIYGGWFWTPISSIPCHWVVIEPDCLFDSLETNEIRLKLGYPNESYFKGIDPRNNKKIFDRLIKDGKAR